MQSIRQDDKAIEIVNRILGRDNKKVKNGSKKNVKRENDISISRQERENRNQ